MPLEIPSYTMEEQKTVRNLGVRIRGIDLSKSQSKEEDEVIVNVKRTCSIGLELPARRVHAERPSLFGCGHHKDLAWRFSHLYMDMPAFYSNLCNVLQYVKCFFMI